jgi:hypothetical protein
MSDLLAAVVRATASASDSSALLDRVAQLLTSRADWVVADRLDEPDLITRVAAYDAHGTLTLPDGMGPAPARRSSAGSVGLLPSLIASPRRVLRLDQAALVELTRTVEPHRALQASLALSAGTRELLLLGLVARDAVVGVLTLGSRTGFRDDEIPELADLALHVGLALDAARLLAVQRTVATTMQTSLLPPLPALPGLRLAARYSPAARGLDVGGDWYDAFRTSAGLVVVIGDASGHDVAAAARMADLRNLLRAYAVDRVEPPSALVSRLEHATDVLQLDGAATCVVGRLTPVAGAGWRLVWTNAGHPPPVLVHAGRAELLETPADLMLGVDPAAERTDHERVLVPGDLLLLYSDGLVEVRGALLEERLELLRRTVEQRAGAQPDPLAEHLLSTLARGATDDVALLILQVLPGSPRAAAIAAGGRAQPVAGDGVTSAGAA